jgi:alkylation response protein AidB-like acyl-CoA dehydrogenase
MGRVGARYDPIAIRKACIPMSQRGLAPQDLPFDDFLTDFRGRLAHLFGQRAALDELSLQRGIPPFIFQEVRAANPQLCSIPRESGGRGAVPLEILAILEAAAYYSLPLSLILGINGALFLEPLAKYGQVSLQERVFPRFTAGSSLGGLMITEPDFGTDAHAMCTTFNASGDAEAPGYHIQGTKHWAGLTGWADFWLVTARRQKLDGSLDRDIGFFVCDSNLPGQVIQVEEFYPNLGLHMIPYGRNLIDVRLPADARLESMTSGLRLLQDLLHRSRMRFPGMACGFLARLYDEAVSHCRERVVSSKTLVHYDQVQSRLAGIQAGHTTAAAFCKHAAELSSIANDLGDHGLIANTHKCVLSDLMHEAAQSLLQLNGAKGYRQDHIAGRALTDSRPFQIFEGSNDVIYHQMFTAFQRYMNSIKELRLAAALRRHPLTASAADLVEKHLEFSLDRTYPQRKLVELGRILGRVISIDLLLKLGERGFEPRLIASAIDVHRVVISRLAASFASPLACGWVEDPAGGPAWQECVDRT